MLEIKTNILTQSNILILPNAKLESLSILILVLIYRSIEIEYIDTGINIPLKTRQALSLR